MQDRDDHHTPESVPRIFDLCNSIEVIVGNRPKRLERLPILVWMKHRQIGDSIPDLLDINLLDHRHHYSYDNGCLFDTVMSCTGIRPRLSDWEARCLTLLGGETATLDLPLRVEDLPCQIRSKKVHATSTDSVYLSLSPDDECDMIAACSFVGSIYLVYGDADTINLVKFDPLLRTAERSYKVLTHEFLCCFFSKTTKVKMRHSQGDYIHVYDSDNLGYADVVATIDNRDYPRDAILPPAPSMLDRAILPRVLRAARQQWLALRPDTPAIAAQRERQIMKNAEGEMPVDATTAHYYSV